MILPRDSLRWLSSQPSNKIDSSPAFNEIDQGVYNFGDAKYFADDWSGNLLRQRITKDLESIISPVNEELELAIDKRLGTDTENSTDVTVLPVMSLIVAQASSRFIVGLPLCKVYPLFL